MESAESTRARILNAAEARFSQFGFNKTTMAEIARDCGMSAANIYRFFESKKDIMVTMAEAYFTATEENLRAVLGRQGLTAAAKMELFTLAVLENTHKLYTEQPRINECVEFICNERYGLIERHKAIKQSMIAEILLEGNARGEFDVEDVVATAGLLSQATILLHYPTFMGIYPWEELERFARRIVNILIYGIAKG